MATTQGNEGVLMGFEDACVRIPLCDILPLRSVTKAVKRTQKYAQIAASIREVGLVEPPVVTRASGDPKKYPLLDGHLRVEVLKDQGESIVSCLISTDDEAFTYNKHISRLTTVQEHRMILEAIRRGVPEDRIARALNVNVKNIRVKRRLLDGICSEVVELFKEKHVPIRSFSELKKMIPLRQIEAAELMVAMDNFTTAYAKSLVSATPFAQLVQSSEPSRRKRLSPEQISLMERETANLEQTFRSVECDYATDHLDLVLAKGYITKLLNNEHVAGYLNKHHSAICEEFLKLTKEPADVLS